MELLSVLGFPQQLWAVSCSYDQLRFSSFLQLGISYLFIALCRRHRTFIIRTFPLPNALFKLQHVRGSNLFYSSDQSNRLITITNSVLTFLFSLKKLRPLCIASWLWVPWFCIVLHKYPTPTPIWLFRPEFIGIVSKIHTKWSIGKIYIQIYVLFFFSVV